MANIFVDPVIITTPPDNTSREGIEAWIANLNIWLKEALTSPFEWLHSLQATLLLYSEGRLPGFELLRNWQRKYQLNINPSQIARNINEFFRNEELDMQGNLEKLGYLVEVETDSILIRPDQFTMRWPTSLQEDMHLLLATTCACKCTDHYFASEMHIVTLELPGVAKEIEISAIIVYAIPDFPRNTDNTIHQSFPLLFTPDDLPLIDVIVLWDKGTKGFIYAIEQRFKKDWHTTVAHPLEFRLGRCFIDSVNDAGLDTSEIVLKRIVNASAAVIAGRAEKVKGYKLHELRETRAGNSPQRIRASDNAKAWRLMIGQHGGGWRLHYWQIPTQEGSVIEFSNVVKESDDTICE
jgi:hypothetical protein